MAGSVCGERHSDGNLVCESVCKCKRRAGCGLGGGSTGHVSSSTPCGLLASSLLQLRHLRLYRS